MWIGHFLTGLAESLSTSLLTTVEKSLGVISRERFDIAPRCPAKVCENQLQFGVGYQVWAQTPLARRSQTRSYPDQRDSKLVIRLRRSVDISGSFAIRHSKALHYGVNLNAPSLPAPYSVPPYQRSVDGSSISPFANQATTAWRRYDLIQHNELPSTSQLPDCQITRRFSCPCPKSIRLL